MAELIPTNNEQAITALPVLAENPLNLNHEIRLLRGLFKKLAASNPAAGRAILNVINQFENHKELAETVSIEQLEVISKKLAEIFREELNLSDAVYQQIRTAQKLEMQRFIKLQLEVKETRSKT